MTAPNALDALREAIENALVTLDEVNKPAAKWLRAATQHVLASEAAAYEQAAELVESTELYGVYGVGLLTYLSRRQIAKRIRMLALAAPSQSKEEQE